MQYFFPLSGDFFPLWFVLFMLIFTLAFQIANALALRCAWSGKKNQEENDNRPKKISRYVHLACQTLRLSVAHRIDAARFIPFGNVRAKPIVWFVVCVKRTTFCLRIKWRAPRWSWSPPVVRPLPSAANRHVCAPHLLRCKSKKKKPYAYRSEPDHMLHSLHESVSRREKETVHHRTC